MPAYNKLVRDKIPDIIRQDGKTCRVRTLSMAEMKPMLQAKLQEEAAEYLGSATDSLALEELADILEVIGALARLHGASMEQLADIQKSKQSARGGFDRAVFLIDVND